MDCRDPRPGVVARIFPGEGMDRVWPERDGFGCPADPFAYGVVELCRQRYRFGNGQIDDEDPCVLTNRYVFLPGDLEIGEDIFKLAACGRVGFFIVCSMQCFLHVGRKDRLGLVNCLFHGGCKTVVEGVHGISV